jgi:hypothetical protein
VEAGESGNEALAGMDLGGIEALVGFHPCARACLRFAAWMCECRGRRRVLRRCALDNLVVPLAANAERSWHAEERATVGARDGARGHAREWVSAPRLRSLLSVRMFEGA